MKPVFSGSRHHRPSSHEDDGEDGGPPQWIPRGALDPVPWRMSKERPTTSSAVLVLCLILGVDPPDARGRSEVRSLGRKHCWVDPASGGSGTGMSVPSSARPGQLIGRALKRQYGVLQPRARYRQCIDPTFSTVRDACAAVRREALTKRALFHYNGAGVPRPSQYGEIWVFNQAFTEYLPVSPFTLHRWIGSPSVFVFDCQNAGLIVNPLVKSFGDKENNIVLASCAATEELPADASLPADVFTCCLTTPVRISLLCHCLEHHVPETRVPGSSDRRTPLGSLAWMLTAITDSIAWSLLWNDGHGPQKREFKRLFREDLLVASLFRNFFLADRIMSQSGSHPISVPAIPDAKSHPLWKEWDRAMGVAVEAVQTANLSLVQDFVAEFFSSQLKEFEGWLESDRERRVKKKQPTAEAEGESEVDVPSSAPNLPILLQCVVGAKHRSTALNLLLSYLGTGESAIANALSVGMFSYAALMLQARSAELAEVVVQIYAHFLHHDDTIKTDIVKDHGMQHFFNVLRMSHESLSLEPGRGNDDDERPATVLRKKYSRDAQLAASFVLSTAMHNSEAGQLDLLGIGEGVVFRVLGAYLRKHSKDDTLLRQWITTVVSQLCEQNEAAQVAAFEARIQNILRGFFETEVANPEFRVSVILALGSLVNSTVSLRRKSDDVVEDEMKIGVLVVENIADGSPLVRKEILFVLARLVVAYVQHLDAQIFLHTAGFYREGFPAWKELKSPTKTGKEPSTLGGEDGDEAGVEVEPREEVDGRGPKFSLGVLRAIVMLASDPSKEVSDVARDILMVLELHFFPPIASEKKKTASAAPAASSQTLDDGMPSAIHSRGRAQAVPRAEDPMPTRRIIHLWKQMPRSGLFSGLASGFLASKKGAKVKHRLLEAAGVSRAAELEERRRVESLDCESSMFGGEEEVRRLKIHAFRPMLLSCDGADKLTLWNYRRQKAMCSFRVGKDAPGKVTDFAILNEMFFRDLLLVASSSGTFCVFENYFRPTRHVLTSFVAVPEVLVDPAVYEGTSGFLTKWQQESGVLIVGGGGIPVVKLWDLGKERLVHSIDTEVKSGINCIASDPTGKTGLFAAGTEDHSLLFFDPRMPKATDAILPPESSTKPTRYISCSIQKVDNMKVICGDGEGVVETWDMRNKTIPLNSHTTKTQNVTAMSVHCLSPVFACGGRAKSLDVYDLSGGQVSSIAYHEGLLGTRISPVSALSFHPDRTLLAAAFTDNIISMYTSSDPVKSYPRSKKMPETEEVQPQALPTQAEQSPPLIMQVVPMVAAKRPIEPRAHASAVHLVEHLRSGLPPRHLEACDRAEAKREAATKEKADSVLRFHLSSLREFVRQQKRAKEEDRDDGDDDDDDEKPQQLPVQVKGHPHLASMWEFLQQGKPSSRRPGEGGL